MDVERAAAAERLVRPDPVEQLPVGLDIGGELLAVVDLVPVEVVVLRRAKCALADAVLAPGDGCPCPGIDVGRSRT